MLQIPLEIPEKVRLKAASLGETGRAWLADLPQYIADLERRWAINVGKSYSGGTEAFVAEARTDEGQDVILKIAIPGIDPKRQEMRTLRAARGKGYAVLIRADEGGSALLLEKLGPQLHEFGLPADRQIEIIFATLQEAWTVPVEEPPFVTGAEKAVELAHIIESNWSASVSPVPNARSTWPYHMRNGGGGHSTQPNPFSCMGMPINGIRYTRRGAPQASNSSIPMAPMLNAPSISSSRCGNGVL